MISKFMLSSPDKELSGTEVSTIVSDKINPFIMEIYTVCKNISTSKTNLLKFKTLVDLITVYNNKDLLEKFIEYTKLLELRQATENTRDTTSREQTSREQTSREQTSREQTSRDDDDANSDFADDDFDQDKVDEMFKMANKKFLENKNFKEFGFEPQYVISFTQRGGAKI